MWSQKAERWLDLPDGALTGELHTAIEGRRRVTLDGACEIAEYTEDAVCFRIGEDVVRIHGERLVLEQYAATGAVVGGRLTAVEFL